ncbi:MAG TPA: hybrid sensor histidine kinase/response regulator [Polyangia bacterium]|nr:hybrid sensor histidine kinase/response regulator [Polyangia bacterium]
MESTNDPASAVPVLAVDDYPINLSALSVILEPLGVTMETASSGAEALQKAGQREFAAILLDVRMPGMDGFETLRRLRELPTSRHTPVTLLTAHELEADALAQLQGMGMVDYLLKPIAPVILRSKIAALIELYQYRATLAAKDRHIAMLAHDLQSPLSSIALAATFLNGVPLEARPRTAVERVMKSARRMSEMVRNLTDFARAGQGGISVTRQRVELRALCEEAADELQGLDAGRVELQFEGELAGEWDRNRLLQAVANLLGNALRYGAGVVTVSGRAAGQSVELMVHNNGTPIPSNFLPMMFRPFQRGAKDRLGLGLGLFIVREIVRAHGGEIAVASTAEAGTTFTIRLPTR